ncbi:MAG: polysulfide reductase NrfD [Deltaproteobacteria bacterium]|nr:polysulfide reductase NrfD [Deltaproteobacteria bacterium]MBW2049578.1 polysulfide reductase NrfD [Deltaproteobacteria bacterium]MBW2110896.1 polysulfide reductase NrfD [Deltaproteobacteria bacterium]MBW2354257.1 polysulfide reductase NrfD [Deltaproteobacteria bacterium]HDZ90651.1 menaquinol oxidoreductase [Deltaproteobacteria bacterium]
MIEKAFHGGKIYWAWISALCVAVVIGLLAYLYQLREGMWVTGMSRDVSWGFYISQFTFLVGVAASVLMVVLPLYLHDFRAFARITVLSQFLAVGALLMSLLFIFSDVGMPMRILNVPLNPTPRSMLFYDTIFLPGFMLLNLIIGWAMLGAEKRGEPPRQWVKALIYLSMPWAIIMHTVTAFIYAGTPGRGFWMTAIMAPRFLTTAFAAGPALLIIISAIIRALTRFRVEERAVQKLVTIMIYALIIDLLFLGVEYFTAFYANIPQYTETFQYLFSGIGDNRALVPWYWCMNMAIAVSIAMLCTPRVRARGPLLVTACVITLAGLWIDKGYVLVPAAFIPNVFGRIMEYPPSWVELTISLGVYALGSLMITALYRVVISIREEEAGLAVKSTSL